MCPYNSSQKLQYMTPSHHARSLTPETVCHEQLHCMHARTARPLSGERCYTYLQLYEYPLRETHSRTAYARIHRYWKRKLSVTDPKRNSPTSWSPTCTPTRFLQPPIVRQDRKSATADFAPP